MNGQTDERLPVIRALIERGVVYRAITARVALIAGVLSILTATAIYLNNEGILTVGRAVRPREFVVLWLITFVIAADATAFLFWWEARRQSRPFFSPEFRLVMRTVFPYFLIPAAFTSWYYNTGYLGARELELVAVWTASYGLALLSTSAFAPPALSRLGWAFLLTTVAVPAIMNVIDFNFSFDLPNALMGLTFGLYHLIYAACTWRRRSAAPSLVNRESL
jgi:hypothetical protein